MGWASHYITTLQSEPFVKFRPRGNSMSPKIKSGDLVTVVRPHPKLQPEVGSIVLCKVGGNEYLHLITAINGPRYQISNNKGHVNGWTGIDKIYGIVTHVGN